MNSYFSYIPLSRQLAVPLTIHQILFNISHLEFSNLHSIPSRTTHKVKYFRYMIRTQAYLNIVNSNFSIKWRCRYHSRYFWIPMYIKIPVGASWHFTDNLDQFRIKNISQKMVVQIKLKPTGEEKIKCRQGAVQKLLASLKNS